LKTEIYFAKCYVKVSNLCPAMCHDQLQHWLNLLYWLLLLLILFGMKISVYCLLI